MTLLVICLAIRFWYPLQNFFADRIRRCDVAARYGGEEFLIMLPGLPGPKARMMLLRLVRDFSEKEHLTDAGEKVRVTFSAGLATHMGEQCYESVADLIKAADSSMYAAKRGDRNRLCSVATTVGVEA